MLHRVIRKLLTLSRNGFRKRDVHFKTKHFVKQKDSMACGIACLQMICKYYDREQLAGSLSNIQIASADGISMLCMEEIANSLGLDTICARVNVEYLIKNINPCILHWNQNHFVVLYKISSKKRFYIADPNRGLVTYTIDEFKKHWVNANDSEGDEGIKNQNIGFIWLILIGQFVLTISRMSMDVIRSWLLLHISLRINISLVSDFFIKLLKLPMSFFTPCLQFAASYQTSVSLEQIEFGVLWQIPVSQYFKSF